MQFELKLTGEGAAEFKQIMKLLLENNLEAASAFEDTAAAAPQTAQDQAPVKVGKVTVKTAKAAAAPAAAPEEKTDAPKREPEEKTEAPKQETAAPEEPTITLQDLQTIGRKLAATGRGKNVQAILKAHGAPLMSKIAITEYPAVYAEMQAAMEAVE